MPWATLSEVQDLPGGEDATQADLDLAQIMIEDLAGTTEVASDQGNISSTNLRRLKNAVIFQTIFIGGHPELLTVQDVTGASGDGVSAQYRTADSQLYAPLASRAVNRLSWRLRGLRTRKYGQTLGEDEGNRDSAAADDAKEWSQL
jgi:hypothetical protein